MPRIARVVIPNYPHHVTSVVIVDRRPFSTTKIIAITLMGILVRMISDSGLS